MLKKLEDMISPKTSREILEKLCRVDMRILELKKLHANDYQKFLAEVKNFTVIGDEKLFKQVYWTTAKAKKNLKKTLKVLKYSKEGLLDKY